MGRFTDLLSKMSGLYTKSQVQSILSDVHKKNDERIAETLCVRTGEDIYYASHNPELNRFDVFLRHRFNDDTGFAQIMIKSFPYERDSDITYARICAEELLDKLNEKP